MAGAQPIQGITLTAAPQVFLAVTPGMIPSNGGRGESTINFKNNCVICLKEEKPEVMLQILQSNPKKMQSFQPIVHYLTGTSTTPGRCRDKGLPKMKNVPPLCATCYEKAAEIYRMHIELLNLEGLIQNMVDELRKVVFGTINKHPKVHNGKSDNELFLERLRVSGGMTQEQVDEMNQFVNNFHGRIHSQVGKRVRFPDYPSSNPGNTESNATPLKPILVIPLSIHQQQQPTSAAGTFTSSSTVIPSAIATAATSPSLIRLPTPALPSIIVPTIPQISNFVPTTPGTVKPTSSALSPPMISTASMIKVPQPITLNRSSTGITISRLASSPPHLPPPRLPLRASQPSAVVPVILPKPSTSTTRFDQSSSHSTPAGSSKPEKGVSSPKIVIKSEKMKSDGNIVIIPGSSRTLKFENETDEVEGNDSDNEMGTLEMRMEEEAEFDETGPPEWRIKEEERIHVYENDRFPCPSSSMPPHKKKKISEDSDEEWQMDQAEDEGSDDDDTDSTDEDKDKQELYRPEKVTVPHRSVARGLTTTAGKRKPTKTIVVITHGENVGLKPLLPKGTSSLPTVVAPGRPLEGDNLVLSYEATRSLNLSTLSEVRKVVGTPSLNRKRELLPKINSNSDTAVSSTSVSVQLNASTVEHVECDICTEKNLPDLLQTHVRRIHYKGRSNGHFCSSCDQVFISRSRLAKHVEMDLCCKDSRPESAKNMLQNLLMCTECSIKPKFPTVAQLRDHVFARHENVDLFPTVATVFKCVICDVKFRTFLGLDFHMNTHVRSKKRFSIYRYATGDYCYQHHLDTCPPGTKDPTAVNAVLSTFLCDLCPEKSLAKDMASHLTNRHGIHIGDLINCSFCLFSTSVSKSYADHMALSHASEAHKPCYICGDTFYRIRCLRLHLWHTHGQGKEEKIVCRFCGQLFALRRTLHAHIQEDHKVPFEYQEKLLAAMKMTNGQIQCQLCSNSKTVYKTLHEFQQHYLAAHYSSHITDIEAQKRINDSKAAEAKCKVNKLFRCTTCNINFTVKRSYSSHMTAFHKGQQQTSQQVQNKGLPPAETVKSPLQTEVDDEDDELLSVEPAPKNPDTSTSTAPCKPKRCGHYRCNLCGNRFLTLFSLNSHEKKSHDKYSTDAENREKMMYCNECGDMFESLADLGEHHEKMHSEEAVAVGTAVKQKLLSPTTPRLFSCVLCHQTFVCEESLHIHDCRPRQIKQIDIIPPPICPSTSSNAPGPTECVVNVTNVPVQPTTAKQSYMPSILRRKQKL